MERVGFLRPASSLSCVALRSVAERCGAERRGALRGNAMRQISLAHRALSCEALRCEALRCVAMRREALRCGAGRGYFLNISISAARLGGSDIDLFSISLVVLDDAAIAIAPSCAILTRIKVRSSCLTFAMSMVCSV